MHRIVAALGQEGRRWSGLPGHVAVEIIKPQSQVEGEALHGPLILREQPEIGFDSVEFRERGCVLPDSVRRSPEQFVRDVAVDRLFVEASLPGNGGPKAVEALFQLQAGFVSSGYVRRDEALRKFVRRLRIVVDVRRVPPELCRLLENRNVRQRRAAERKLRPR